MVHRNTVSRSTVHRSTAPRSVVPSPLTTEAFSAYGDVIEASQAATILNINRGYTQRFHDLAPVDVLEQGGLPLINIFRATPLPTPLIITSMERHPLSSQAFMPLGGSPYLVVVAARGKFDPTAIKVFLAKGCQGVNYNRGTWHHFCLPLGECHDFLVIDRGGTGENCDEVMLKESEQIRVLVE